MGLPKTIQKFRNKLEGPLEIRVGRPDVQVKQLKR
jgi:hypothetical protein